MIKAKDIMTKEVICVKRDTPIYETIELLVKKEITGIPVVEDDMSLVGIVSEKDVLSLFYDYEDGKDKTAGDYMTQPAVCYNEDDSLQTICDFMMINYFRRVPVTSKEGKLVGIISRPDVLKYILKVRGEETSGAG